MKVLLVETAAASQPDAAAVADADLVIFFNSATGSSWAVKWRDGLTEDVTVRHVGEPAREDIARHARGLLRELEGAWWLRAAGHYRNLEQLVGRPDAGEPTGHHAEGRPGGG